MYTRQQNGKQKAFSLEKALLKINQDLQSAGLPVILSDSVFFVERGNFLCCQVKARRVRKGAKGRLPKGETLWVYGFGFSKYNPQDAKSHGLEYDPNMGRRLALSRAVSDLVTACKETSK